MKRDAFLVLLLAMSLLMLLPVTGSVNITPSDHPTATSVLMASGSPGPAPVPSGIGSTQPKLIASGSPGPAPVPHTIPEPSLIASGSPGPAPVPGGSARRSLY